MPGGREAPVETCRLVQTYCPRRRAIADPQQALLAGQGRQQKIQAATDHIPVSDQRRTRDVGNLDGVDIQQFDRAGCTAIGYPQATAAVGIQRAEEQPIIVRHQVTRCAMPGSWHQVGDQLRPCRAAIAAPQFAARSPIVGGKIQEVRRCREMLDSPGFR